MSSREQFTCHLHLRLSEPRSQHIGVPVTADLTGIQIKLPLKLFPRSSGPSIYLSAINAKTRDYALKRQLNSQPSQRLLSLISLTLSLINSCPDNCLL